ncbi:MAG: hypothetical protein QF886_24045, partial [Planctomycetota bacterium]|nr:hypothetical protein [Planctomycetota bacterium]
MNPSKGAPKPGKRQKSGKSDRSESLETKADSICEQLKQLADDLWEARRMELSQDAAVPELELTFKLGFNGNSSESTTTGASLLHDLSSALDQHYRPLGYAPGRVYCYFCENSDCEHAAPPDQKDVFNGYT